MQKAEVQIELDKLRRDILEKVCPIFQECCKGGRCMSYAPGYIWENGIKAGAVMKYGTMGINISPPSCSNAIVTGTIEYQEP